MVFIGEKVKKLLEQPNSASESFLHVDTLAGMDAVVDNNCTKYLPDVHSVTKSENVMGEYLLLAWKDLRP